MHLPALMPAGVLQKTVFVIFGADISHFTQFSVCLLILVAISVRKRYDIVHKNKRYWSIHFAT